MATIKISGCIVYETTGRRYRFRDYLEPEDFSDDHYRAACQGDVLVCGHTIEIDEPESLDLITPQLRELDRQEADLSAKYQAAKTQIQAKRESLLAIECAVQS